MVDEVDEVYEAVIIEIDFLYLPIKRRAGNYGSKEVGNIHYERFKNSYPFR